MAWIARKPFCVYKGVFLFVLVVIALGVTSRKLQDVIMMMERHEQWMAQYGRFYKDEAEKDMRLEIFRRNAEFIKSFNAAGEKPYMLGINAFADLTPDEFCTSRNGYKRSVPRSVGGIFKYENVTVMPDSMDWRRKGAVTPIKNQGQCGSCWVFSDAATEGIHQLTTGKLESLSEQELVDFNIKGKDRGREGGLMEDAFEFIIKNKGIASESIYPYVGTNGTSNVAKEASRVVTIKGYESFPANSEDALPKARLMTGLSAGS